MARACQCRFVHRVVFVLLILITHPFTSLLFRPEADRPAGLGRQAVFLADYSGFRIPRFAALDTDSYHSDPAVQLGHLEFEHLL